MNVHGRTLIIVNPQGVSLRRSASRELASAADGKQVVLLETEHAGHAGEFCRRHAGEFDKVIAVGGDGLLMDVVNGTMGTDVAIAPLPAGSASDFAKVLPGYPLGLEALLGATGRMRMDVGRVTFTDGSSRHFVTEAGTGLDAAALRLIPNWLRSLSAARAYDLAALRAVASFKPFQARVELDGEVLELDRLQLLAVCNTRFVGGGMPMAPDAKPDDGLFHVFALAGASRLDILKSFVSLRNGTHIYHPKSVYRACRTVRLEADRELETCVDGDLIGRTPRTWEILAGQLQVIAP